MKPALLLLGLIASAAAAAAGQPSPPASSPPRSAAPAADERLRVIRERKKALETVLARLRSQEKSLLGEVERVELEERLRGEELRETKLLLDRTNAQMDQTLRRVRDLERSVAEARPVLAARARALYKLGELSYLRLLLSVEHPSDLFRGYRFVTTLARRDNQRMSAFRADLAALAATRTELEARTQQALSLRADLERTRQGLEADRKKKTALLTQIVERKETHAAYVKELEDAEAKLGQLLQGLAEGDVAVPLSAFKGTLPWPVAGRVRVPFGLRRHSKFDVYTIQNGIEIEAAADTAVAAVHDGIVAFADRFQGYGLLVILDHGGKHYSLYAHLADVAVQVGQKLETGDTLGTVGAGLEGPGLYFEMRFQGRPEDPTEWLSKPESGPALSGRF